jgi:hypothetical protein
MILIMVFVGVSENFVLITLAEFHGFLVTTYSMKAYASPQDPQPFEYNTRAWNMFVLSLCVDSYVTVIITVD